MATTFHIPDELLTRLDKHVKARKLSRNRFVILALQKALRDEEEWSTEFLDAIDNKDPSMAKEVDAMMDAIQKHRASKDPPSL